MSSLKGWTVTNGHTNGGLTIIIQVKMRIVFSDLSVCRHYNFHLMQVFVILITTLPPSFWHFNHHPPCMYSTRCPPVCNDICYKIKSIRGKKWFSKDEESRLDYVGCLQNRSPFYPIWSKISGLNICKRPQSPPCLL